MKPELQRRVQRYGWDLAATSYDPCWQRNLAPVQEALLDMAALQPGERVLDMACGTGLLTRSLAAAVGPAGTIVGTDLSEKMVAHARQAARAQGIENASFARMDAEALDLPDGSFDVALCSLGLMYVPDTLRAIQELGRVLRPGGRMVLSVWGARQRCGWAELFPIVDRRVKSEVCPLFFRLGTGDALRGEMEIAGLVELDVKHLETHALFETPALACAAAFAAGPVALAYSRWDAPLKEEAHAEYLASIASYRSGDGYRVPGAFVLALGYKPGSAPI